MSSIRNFIPLEKLGEGTYSNVYKVKRLNDQQIYALKKVKMDSLTHKQKQNALNQVRILASIDSEFIVGYKEAFFDQSLNVLCVVMEYASDGDLQKYIKEYLKTYRLISQEQIWRAAQHILKGLENLHQRGILHRDIKCANIFKCKNTYKLGDLNVSKVNGDKLAYTQTGTPYYASPQVWRDQPYDSKSDIWSFGCIIYEMATLKPPFQGKDMEDLFKNVQKAKLNPLSNHYSQQLWEFILLCLQKDPKKRNSAKQLIQKLNLYQKQYKNLNKDFNKVNNPQAKKNPTQALLKTIKVPTDLKKLKESLPQSKYKKNAIEISVKENKSNLTVKNSVSQVKSAAKMDYQANFLNSKHQNRVFIQNINRSEIFQIPNHAVNYQNSYKSPKNKIQQNKILLKSPRSQVRLGKKVESQPKQSQRLYMSDKKVHHSMKVEKGNPMQNYIKMTENSQSLLYLKKPSSMPRTQKMQALINNSNVSDVSINVNLSNIQKESLNSIHNKIIGEDIKKSEALDQWKKKLVKKGRILSSNHQKPSWWS